MLRKDNRDLHGISKQCNVNGSDIVNIKLECCGALKTPIYSTLRRHFGSQSQNGGFWNKL